MKKIQLTKGQFALIDDEDFERVNMLKWNFGAEGYALRNSSRKLNHGKQKKIMMHRFILDVPDNLQVDHIDGDRLDNRKDNLRLATHQQNHWNQKKFKNTLSKYKGVYWHKGNKKYIVSINANGKLIYLGYYQDPIEAAHVYDEAAKFWFGAWARTNF